MFRQLTTKKTKNRKEKTIKNTGKKIKSKQQEKGKKNKKRRNIQNNFQKDAKVVIKNLDMLEF